MEKSCIEFSEALASKSPTPGGGGASAFCGALSASLASMVSNLTIGKKKYADFENEAVDILKKATSLRAELLKLAQKDEEVFAPLAKAYSLPSQTDEEAKEKERILEDASYKAALVPLSMMEKITEVIYLHKTLAEKGSRLAVSDAGVGALFGKSALLGASMNIFINTKTLKNRSLAKELNEKAEALIKEGSAVADEVYNYVRKTLVEE